LAFLSMCSFMSCACPVRSRLVSLTARPEEPVTVMSWTSAGMSHRPRPACRKGGAAAPAARAGRRRPARPGVASVDCEQPRPGESTRSSNRAHRRVPAGFDRGRPTSLPAGSTRRPSGFSSPAGQPATPSPQAGPGGAGRCDQANVAAGRGGPLGPRQGLRPAGGAAGGQALAGRGPAQARTQLRRARLNARVWWEVAGSEREG
jgi:hypothetical protein